MALENASLSGSAGASPSRFRCWQEDVLAALVVVVRRGVRSFGYRAADSAQHHAHLVRAAVVVQVELRLGQCGAVEMNFTNSALDSVGVLHVEAIRRAAVAKGDREAGPGLWHARVEAHTRPAALKAE